MIVQVVNLRVDQIQSRLVHSKFAVGGECKVSVHTEIGDPVARLPCLKNAVVMSRLPVANVLVSRREEGGVRPEVNCVNLPWRM